MGIIDGFVYAHNYHRHNMERKFEDCMEGKPNTRTCQTIEMEKPTSLMVKPQLVRAPSPAHSMEDFISIWPGRYH